MNGLCGLAAEDLGLQSALQELLQCEAQHVIKPTLALLQRAQADHAVHQRLAY